MSSREVIGFRKENIYKTPNSVFLNTSNRNFTSKYRGNGSVEDSKV